jgi:hypothetical protein
MEELRFNERQARMMCRSGIAIAARKRTTKRGCTHMAVGILLLGWGAGYHLTLAARLMALIYTSLCIITRSLSMILMVLQRLWLRRVL